MKRTLIWLLCACSLAACAAERDLQPLGRVDVALVAPGGGGAVYRLPAGSALSIGSATYADTFPLDNDGPLVSINVPAGEYLAFLVHPLGYGSVWPLERERGGVVETVDATLRTVMPAALSVPDGFSVSLILTFEVADGGVIVFSRGTIDVSLQIDETVGTNGGVGLAAQLAVSDVLLEPAAPAALAPRLPAVGDGGIETLMVGDLPAAGWVQRSATMACTALDAVGFDTSGNDFFIDHFAESSAGQRQLCVDTAANAYVFVNRFGPPTQPRFADLGTQMQFQTTFVFGLPAPAFDGARLDLGVLAGTRTVPVFASQTISDFSGATPAFWVQVSYGGTLTFRFTPTGG
jgi:hypothetical protein